MTKRCVNLLVPLAAVSAASVCVQVLAQSCQRQWLTTAGQGVSEPVTAATVWYANGADSGVGTLVVGGINQDAGGVFCRAWSVSRWQPVGGAICGVSPGYSVTGVYALTSYNAQLVAGGTFNMAGGVVCNAIAAWDGMSWHPLGSGISGLVTSLTTFNGELIAAGRFTVAGGVACGNIARWDGTQWRALGAGVASSDDSQAIDAVTAFGGELIAAGYFASAGGVACKNIAAWDGVAWHPLGAGVGANGEAVYALAVSNDALFAGGYFHVAGSVACSNVAAWAGGVWHPVSTGLTTYVQAMAAVDTVVAAGTSVWDGWAWQPMGTGVNGTVAAMTVYNHDLILGGTFDSAGGRDALHWAKWGFGSTDFNNDGDLGTDRDIEDFFACLGGTCCATCGSADFNGDGDVGTDADIESFFRVLAGGPC